MPPTRRIVAMGGGGFQMEPDNLLLDGHVLELARASSGRERPLHGGLGILEGSLSPHYGGERQRRPIFRRLVADGTLPSGHGIDDGAALVFHDRELVEVVSSSEGATAYRVEPDGVGGAVETPLPSRYLG